MNRISALARVSPLADIEQSMRGNTVTVADGAMIDSFVKVKFAGGDGNVVIGAGSYLNSGVVVYSGHGVTLGTGVLVAANTTFAATNHAYSRRGQTIVEQRFMPSRGGIVVEDDCWIGANCVLLDGTVLRRGCVVAAGTILRGEWPPFAVIAGNPASIMRYRE